MYLDKVCRQSNSLYFGHRENTMRIVRGMKQNTAVEIINSN